MIENSKLFKPNMNLFNFDYTTNNEPIRVPSASELVCIPSNNSLLRVCCEGLHKSKNFSARKLGYDDKVNVLKKN